MILPSMMLSGLILLSASYCSGSIWRLYAFFLAAGVVNSGAAPVSFANLISHWFDKRRGLALGAMSVGMGAGAFFMPSIAQHLIARFGWRFAYGAVGAGILLITVPVLSLLLKDRPEHKTLLPGGAITALEGESDGSTLPEAWRTRTFWVLPSACVIVAASMYACFAHVPAILTDRGISPRNAALASSLFSAGTLAGRAGSGYLLDRFFAPRVAALIFGCALLESSFWVLPARRSLHGWLHSSWVSVGGAEADVKPYMIGRYFGLRSFGGTYGVIFGGFLLGGGLGAYLMGAAFDATHSYKLGLDIACLWVFTTAVLMMLLGPYCYQPQVQLETGPPPHVIPSDLSVRPSK